MGRTIAYCRVSSRDQNPGLQLDALDTHGYDRLFAETESGKRGVQRPEFTAALSALQRGWTYIGTGSHVKAVRVGQLGCPGSGRRGP